MIATAPNISDNCLIQLMCNLLTMREKEFLKMKIELRKGNTAKFDRFFKKYHKSIENYLKKEFHCSDGEARKVMFEVFCKFWNQLEEDRVLNNDLLNQLRRSAKNIFYQQLNKKQHSPFSCLNVEEAEYLLNHKNQTDTPQGMILKESRSQRFEIVHHFWQNLSENYRKIFQKFFFDLKLSPTDQNPTPNSFTYSQCNTLLRRFFKKEHEVSE